MSEERYILNASSSPEADSSDKKRKRPSVAPEEELEIDVNLPEPPSKKAKRAEKKKSSKKSKTAEVSEAARALAQEYFNSDAAQAKGPTGSGSDQKRSEYGIWIGNLPWTATRDTLRQFLDDHGKIDGKDIVRLHMPAPNDKGEHRVQKPQNKGFAYVDFTSAEVLGRALALSEKLMTGRRVLIKNAKSFEGRPEKPAPATSEAAKKEPSKRIFVGNLSFDVTKEDLEEHFGQAGETEDVHMATFEDSGKCKGFAWIRFTEVASAEKAVKGYIWKDKADVGGSEESDAEERPVKKEVKKSRSKQDKWFINRLQGRLLRCEFAEDAQTRYKKRYGKDTRDRTDGLRASPDYTPAVQPTDEKADEGELASLVKQAAAARQVKREKPQRREKKPDARTIAPGAANAKAPRATGAIVAAAGKKVTFS